MLLAAAVLAAATTCAAEPPLADANAYVRGLVGGQRRQEQALSSYTYDVTESREDLDGEGRATRRRTRSYEVYHVNGRPVRRLMTRDGLPLSAAERRRIDARAQALAEAIRKGETVSEEPGVRLSRILERYDFRFAGREEVEGRCALVFEFSPRPGEFRLDRDFVLKKLAGRLWVDEQDRAVARLDVRNTASVKVALGLGASVSSASFHGEFLRLEPGLWLPRRLEAGAAGRKLLFIGFRVRETLAFGNYRRFDVSTEEQVRP
jgi:hypothetical protein